MTDLPPPAPPRPVPTVRPAPDRLAQPAGRPPSRPDLSVVIAARDAAATLGAQLAALAAQRTEATWEVVVADNGSTDRTVEVARSFADRLPALHVVDASARPGAGQARNIGATVATGRYLLFCDADDVVADGWLTALHAAARPHHLAAGRFDGTRLNRPRDLRSRALPQTDGLQRSVHLPALPHAGAGNLAVRADLFRAVGGFDPQVRFLEDTDLCWRLQLAGARLTWAPDALVHVRLRGTLRTAARQGFDYGTGEHWLALRYRDLADLAEPVDLAESADLAEPADLAVLADPTGLADPADPAGPAGSTDLPPSDPDRRTSSEPAVLPDPRPSLPAPSRTSGPGSARVLRRAVATVRSLLRVRSLGDLGAWCWDVGWGLGYAYARVDAPAPLTVRALSAPPPTPEEPPARARSLDDPSSAPPPD